MRDLHSSKPNPGKVSRQTKTFKGEYKKQLENRAIIVGCHCDTENKMKMTEELLEKIRKKYYDKICLVVASHLSVSEKIQSLGDYVILNKNNPIINLDLFNDISNTITFIEWPQIIDKKPDNLIELDFKYEENHQKRSVQIKGLTL